MTFIVNHFKICQKLSNLRNTTLKSNEWQTFREEGWEICNRNMIWKQYPSVQVKNYSRNVHLSLFELKPSIERTIVKNYNRKKDSLLFSQIFNSIIHRRNSAKLSKNSFCKVCTIKGARNVLGQSLVVQTKNYLKGKK